MGAAIAYYGTKSGLDITVLEKKGISEWNIFKMRWKYTSD